jgi:ABC-type multidrug transport system ATPase subunit
VDRLNLHIEAGKFLTLLGPSGSGKTTTLMMLAGFESVSEGTIRLNGQPIERLPKEVLVHCRLLAWWGLVSSFTLAFQRANPPKGVRS